MAVRTALLNGNNINLDSDFSKYVESLTSQGVISGFDMTTTSVGVGKAFVKCTRTNGETIMVYVENTESISISGNGYIVIKVPQAMIDDGTNNPADGIGIATVELVETLPSANYMTLGQIVGGVLADVRYFIPKVQNIDTLNTRMTTAEADIEALELAGVPNHLEQSGVIGEKYALTDKMLRQAEPTAENSTSGHNVGDVAANKQVHIQRIGSGTASNTITLKVKTVGSPTTTLHCDVYQGQKYDVSGTESAWYGTGTALATSSKAYTNFSNDWATVTFTLNNAVGGTKGQLLDIVVYQEGNIVNASNYYVLACDNSVYTEAFRCLGVNGTTRKQSYLMTYCHSDGFLQYLLCKNYSIDQSGTSGTVFGPIQKNMTAYNNSTDFYWYNPYSFAITGYIEFWWSVVYDRYYANFQGALNQSIRGSNTQTRNTNTFTIQPGGYVRCYLTDQYGSANVYSATCKFTFYGSPFEMSKEKADSIIGIPLELKQLGENGKMNIFGTDENELFNGMKEILSSKNETSTTATTGSITPGNFVGYITVGNYKIPYYNK